MGSHTLRNNDKEKIDLEKKYCLSVISRLHQVFNSGHDSIIWVILAPLFTEELVSELESGTWSPRPD